MQTTEKVAVLFLCRIVCCFLMVIPLGTGQQQSCVSVTATLDQAELERCLSPPGACVRVPRSQQVIIPDINFTCNGTITKWTFYAYVEGVVNLSTSAAVDLELQIWRRVVDNSYIKIGARTPNIKAKLVLNSSMIFESRLETPLPFQAGDILGIFQPIPSRSTLSIYFNRSTGGPINYYMDADTPASQFNISEDLMWRFGLPLLTVNMSVPIDTESTMTTTLAPTPTPLPAPSVIQRTITASSMPASAALITAVTQVTTPPITSPTPMLTTSPTLDNTVSNSPSSVHPVVATNAAVTVITTTLQPSSTITPQPESTFELGTTEPIPTVTPKNTSGPALELGTTGGVLTAVMVIAAAAIAIIVIALKKKKKKKRNNGTKQKITCDHVLENPVYQYAGGALGHCERNVGNRYTPTPLEPPRSTTYLTNSLGSSFLLTDVRSPHPYLEPVTTAQRMMPLYEWGFYVPSEEQRNAFAVGNGWQTHVASSVMAQTQISPSGPRTVFFEERDSYWKPSSNKADLFGQLSTNKYREIPRYQIQITDYLGDGHFGTVNKGIWQLPAGAKEVAVKTLRAEATEMDAVKFLQEAAINGQFKHLNVMKLYGVVTTGVPVMIVLELLTNGDLRRHLIKQQPAPGEMVPSHMSQTLLNFCRQIAAGMDYLARKAFIHRDLAARNILLSEDKTCKIGDFGMSRDLEDEDYYVARGGMVPVKWTAPEAIKYMKFSTASDVWSFGVVMYEIWSLGHKPFENHTNTQTVELVECGYRLPPPPGCPKEVYKWMIGCWNPVKSTRPQFSQLSEALNQPDFDLLTWSEEDTGVHPQAMVLGAPLEAGKQLYPELQNSYNYSEQQSLPNRIATM